MSQQNEIRTKDLVKIYFGAEPIKDGNQWKCKCGKIRKQDITTGYANLKSHITQSHLDYKEVYAEVMSKQNEVGPTEENHEAVGNQQKHLDLFFDSKSNNIYKWLKWIIEDELSLNFPEKTNTRNYTNLDKISTKTAKKYGFEIEHIVSNMIIDKIEKVNHIALIFDGWTAGSTHFIGVFASLPAPDKEKLPKLYLLRFAPLLDGTSFTAEAHRIFLMETLEFYKIPESKVFCLVGDNCNTNKCLANLMGKPLIGCRSHRYNLAMEGYLAQQVRNESKSVHTLMTKLKTLKGAGQLRRLTGLKPQTRNATRWSSSVKSLKQYVKLKPFLNGADTDIQEVAPSARESKKIVESLPLLTKLNNVTVALQSQDMTLVKSDSIFKEVISKVTTFDFDKYIGLNADIVHNKLLESALIKIQGGNESYLTEEESLVVLPLKKVVAIDNDGMYKVPYWV